MRRCRTAMCAAVVALAASVLRAQVPVTYAQVGVPKGGIREGEVEAHLAPPAPGDTRFVRAYRYNTTSEMMFSYFKDRLGGKRDFDVVQDSATLEPDETTPMSYHIDFHTFEDECADVVATAAPASASARSCKTWRRGADKKPAFLQIPRLSFQGEPGLWIDRAAFTWFVRGSDGVWVRWRVQLRDIGVTSHWERHQPPREGVVQAVTHKRPTPPPP